VCEPDFRVLPTGSLTGDCANDGTATTGFSQMRCGNSLILGNPPLEIERHPALSFDLSGLPSDPKIESARLYVYQEVIYGDGPYTDQMRQVVAEHVEFTTLFGGCHTWSPIAGTIGQVLVSDSAALGWRSADITAAALYGLAATPSRVQLRLRFLPVMVDGDGEDDLAVFASDNSTTPDWRPFLHLRFASP
jgi:hypothetical protein